MKFSNLIYLKRQNLLEEKWGKNLPNEYFLGLNTVGRSDQLEGRELLLEPVFQLPDAVRVACYEGTPTQLLPQLSVHELDLVLSDAPIAPSIKVRAFSHLLGECGIAFFASPGLARRLRPGFPRSLDGEPALLPTESASMRSTLEKWFDSVGVRPFVVAEFEDIELMRVFGQHGRGFFAAHDVITDEIASGYDVERIGSIDGQSERFYAISVERRIKHPAVVAITEAARSTFFGSQDTRSD